ncbi:PadR family transcriptional regulator [Streptococcus pneumoniae]
MKETQLLKGVLEGCVLDMIGQKERYGYELVQTLREAGFDTIVPGTIYPLLQKLEKNQWIRGDMRPSPGGPDRKYFSLMKEGEERVSVFWQQWDDLSQKVEGIKNGG